MQILEEKILDPVILKLWSLIQQNGNYGVPLNEIYSSLQNEYKKEEIDEALSYLDKLYLVAYEKDINNNCILIRKGEILGGILESIPCIGCEHLHECHVGGERFSPENCDEMREWLDRAIEFYNKIGKNKTNM